MAVDRSLSFRTVVGTMVVVALALMLQACSSDGKNDSLFPLPPVKLVVPDTSNNRVLIYTGPFVTGQAAGVVLGQANFTSSASAASATGLASPAAVTLDRSGNLYVADNLNCRVLQYKPQFANGMAATLALGQPDLSTGGCNPSSPAPATDSNLGSATGAAADSSGNLWVADGSHSRVVEYKAALSTGEAATTVLGQADLTSGGTCPGNQTPTASTLCNPEGMAIDSAGNLWVADFGSNRVVRYSPPFSNGMDATLELGQPSGTAFTSGTANNGGISASTLSGPGGVSLDSSGNVWVADTNNNRVLKYSSPFSNGMAATLVLGQSDFGSSTSAATATNLNVPEGLQFNSDGSLFVGDTGNNRTLLFTPPFSNGMAASNVIGQADFTSSSANQGNSSPSATSQNSPYAAGPSWIALSVLAALVCGWFFMKRRLGLKQESRA